MSYIEKDAHLVDPIRLAGEAVSELRITANSGGLVDHERVTDLSTRLSVVRIAHQAVPRTVEMVDVESGHTAAESALTIVRDISDPFKQINALDIVIAEAQAEKARIESELEI